MDRYFIFLKQIAISRSKVVEIDTVTNHNIENKTTFGMFY